MNHYIIQAIDEEFGILANETAADFAACLSKVRVMAERFPSKAISAFYPDFIDSDDIEMAFDGLSQRERDAIAIVTGQGRRLAVERSLA